MSFSLFTRVAMLLGMLLTPAVLPAQTTYLQERFNDGSRTNLQPTTSAAWFASSSTALVFTNGTTETNGSLAVDTGSSRTLVGYFTAAESPVSVAPGQTLTLEVRFSLSADAGSSAGTMIGLLRADPNPDATNGTGFTRVEVDGVNVNGRVHGDYGSSNPANGTFAHYVGYAIRTNFGATSGNVTDLRRRNVTVPGTAGLNNSSGTWSVIGSATGPGAAIPQGGTALRAVLKLTHTAEGQMKLEYLLFEGTDIIASHSATEATATVTSFDTVNIYLPSNAVTGGGSMILQQVDVSLVAEGSFVAPEFTIQPEDADVAMGGTATFTVAASGTPAPAYQWQKDGETIPGATMATLTVSNVQLGDAGDYRAIATNLLGSAPSQPARLTVLTAPEIVTPPQTQAVLLGAPAELTVAATGSEPLSYRWFKDGAELAGATGASLSFASITAADAGDYHVVVSNVVDSVGSSVATLSVTTTAIAPTITTPPASQTVPLGGIATFTVQVQGTAPFSYEWKRGTQTIPAATGPELVIDPVMTTDDADYFVIVRNAGGEAESEAARLTVLLPPSISTQPQNVAIAEGGSGQLGVVAAGGEPLSYQWFKGSDEVAGATDPVLIFNEAHPNDAGSYWVRVSNLAGWADSATAEVTIQSPARLIFVSPSQSAMTGGQVTLQAEATGSQPLVYQWFKDGEAIDGAVEPNLTLSPVQTSDAGFYRVSVANDFGSDESSPLQLTVMPGLPRSAFNLEGFGRLATGGGQLSPGDPGYVRVYTAEDFRLAITTRGVRIIEIMNDLNLGWNEIPAASRTGRFRSNAAAKLHPTLIASGVSLIDVQDLSDLTIFSVHGATIRHAELNIKRVNNVIIRNLKFDGLWEWDEATKGDYDSNDWDYITIDNGSTNIWIDHCDFGKAYDGVVDIKGGSHNITISWCRFLEDDLSPTGYVMTQLNKLEENPSAYPMYGFLRANGFSLNDIAAIVASQKKGHLVGATSFASDNPQLNLTLHHTLYVGMQDRLPRLRAGNAHVYNIHVDNQNAYAAKLLYDQRVAAMSPSEAAKLSNGTFKFGVTQNGAISTENGAVLVESSYFDGVRWALRNNQTDVNNPAYTGKIKAIDMIYKFGETDFRGGSDDPGHPLGPVQAPVIPFSFSGIPGLPYSYVLDDVAMVPDVLTLGAGAGRLAFGIEDWLKTSYEAGGVPPVIGASPQDETVEAGSGVVFAVTVSGSAPFSFQWRKDGVAIEGANANNLVLENVTLENAGLYDVVVWNDYGEDTSDPAQLTVNPRTVTPSLVILNDQFADGTRSNQSLPESAAWWTSSGSGGFTATVGSATQQVSTSRTFLSYFAPAADAPIGLAVGESLELDFVFRMSGFDTASSTPVMTMALLQSVANPNATSAGSWFVATPPPNTTARVVADFGSNNPTNGAFVDYKGYAAMTTVRSEGSATPVVFRARHGQHNGLLNNSTPMTNLPAGSPTASAGMQTNTDYRGTFTVNRAHGQVNVAYRLIRVSDGAVIMEHTSSDGTFGFSTFDTAAFYFSNGAASFDVTMTRITVTKQTPAVAAAPVITTPLEDATVTVGGDATFTVGATGTEPLSYEWYKGAVRLDGPAAATLSLTGVTLDDAGDYTVVVRNDFGHASSTASLAVQPILTPPAIVTGPESQTVTVGDRVTLAVEATGSAPLSYQWSRNGDEIGGATAATLVLDPVTTADAGAYRVTVTNAVDQVTSAAALLVVLKAPANVVVTDLLQTYDGQPKPVSVTTVPAGLTVQVTYDGGSTAPTDAGEYAVVATVADADHAGVAEALLVIEPATVTLSLGDLRQRYAGEARPVTVNSDHNVVITYDGDEAVPVYPGRYAVRADIEERNYRGEEEAVLEIVPTVWVRHAPALSGGVDGSVQVALPESISLNNGAWIASDLLVPGVPTLQANARATYAGVLDGPGAAAPTDHRVSLAVKSVLRYLVRRIDAPTMPEPLAAVAGTGNRSVSLSSPNQSPGPFETLRDLTLNRNVGLITLPEGQYRNFAANTGSGFVLGQPEATEPTVYHLRSLTLNQGAKLVIAGPVILVVAEQVSLNSADVEWRDAASFQLQVHGGGLTLNGSSNFRGQVLAPTGTVTVNRSATLVGEIISSKLSLNGGQVIEPAD